MQLIALGIIGTILYWTYWAITTYWYVVLVGALLIWGGPPLAGFLETKWKKYSNKLNDHLGREQSLNEHFSRFSDKEIKLYSYHFFFVLVFFASLFIAYYGVLEIADFAKSERWIYEVPRDYRDLQYVFWPLLFCVVLITMFRFLLFVFNAVQKNAMLFHSYKKLLEHAQQAKTSEAALEYAPSLREAAKHHIRSPYDLFVFFKSRKTPQTAHYKGARLRDTLSYLERHFPGQDADENFRRRYWNYARHIFRVLDFREDPTIENSIFALPYPEDDKIKEQDVRDQLKREREKFQNEPISVWSKSPDQITLDDALEIVGLSDVPQLKILHKLHLAVEEDHKDDPQKQKLTAKAFELLGRAAVEKEMA